MQNNLQINQVVIWGHKLHTHTHSYIHNGFFIAFNNLGYKTLWLDDNDDVSNIDFANSFFITEHQVNKKIPCRKDCLYLSHYVDNGDYPGVPVENIIILKVSKRDFYEPDKDLNKNYHYTNLQYGQKFEYHSKINNYNCFYMYWATDLLPAQIDENIKQLHNTNSSSQINFVGCMTNIWHNFQQNVSRFGIQFNHYGGTFDKNSSQNKTIDENAKLIRDSLISPALQDDKQINYKYIPCRIFKNISYGKMGLTNNPIVQELFDNKLIYDADLFMLINKGLQFESTTDKNTIVKELMEIVRDNHTYLNRIFSIQRFIKDYTSFVL